MSCLDPSKKSPENINQSDRLEWVDIAKGAAIILMVMGHTGIPKPLHNWIYSFHMPLFFVLSGALTSWNKGICNFAWHKTKTLMLYFFIYSIINFLLLQFCPIKFNQQSIVYLLTEGWGGFALWFIPVLYFSLIICRFIRNEHILTGILVFLIFAWTLATYSISLPWSLTSIPYSSALVLIGRYYANLIKNTSTAPPRYVVFILLGSLLGGATISHFYNLDIIANLILPVIPITISAMLGVTFLILASVWTGKISIVKTIMRPIGQHTLEVLAFSQILLLLQNFKCHFAIKYAIMTLGICLIVWIKQHIQLLFKKI